MFDLKKIVKKIKEHWTISLITLMLLGAGLLELLSKIFIKKTIIISFFAKAFDKYIPDINIEVNLRLLFLRYLIVFLFPILVSLILKKKKYKYVPIIFEGNKQIVRFSLKKGTSKEDTHGELICGKCRNLFKLIKAYNYGPSGCIYSCKTIDCDKTYSGLECDKIIATARSKWIKSIF